MMLPSSTPIPADHPSLRELVDQLGCEGVPVTVTHSSAQLPPSQCYRNVDDRVRRFGGKMKVGWMLRMWPGIYLCAEHHAVWQRPEGKLVDVTKPGGSIVGRAFTTFLEDDRIRVDPTRPPNIRSQYLALSESVDTAEFIARYNEFHASTDRLIVATVSGDHSAIAILVQERAAAQQRMFQARDRLAGKAR